jgi:hypothetical protein
MRKWKNTLFLRSNADGIPVIPLIPYLPNQKDEPNWISPARLAFRGGCLDYTACWLLKNDLHIKTNKYFQTVSQKCETVVCNGCIIILSDEPAKPLRGSPTWSSHMCLRHSAGTFTRLGRRSLLLAHQRLGLDIPLNHRLLFPSEYRVCPIALQ